MLGGIGTATSSPTISGRRYCWTTHPTYSAESPCSAEMKPPHPRRQFQVGATVGQRNSRVAPSRRARRNWYRHIFADHFRSALRNPHRRAEPQCSAELVLPHLRRPFQVGATVGHCISRVSPSRSARRKWNRRIFADHFRSALRDGRRSTDRYPTCC